MSRDWFELDNKGIVRLKTEAKGIPEIKELLKLKDTDKYWQYIWHLCSHKSPYATSEDQEREETVRQDFLKEEPSELLLKTVDRYRNSLETTSMRLLRAAKKAALNIAVYLEESAKQEEMENIKEVVGTLEKIGKIVESLDKLEDRVKKEITNEERLRGGGTVNNRER